MNIEVVETKRTNIVEQFDEEECVIIIDHNCDEGHIFEIYVEGCVFGLKREGMEKFSKVIKKALALQAK